MERAQYQMTILLFLSLLLWKATMSETTNQTDLAKGKYSDILKYVLGC